VTAAMGIAGMRAARGFSERAFATATAEALEHAATTNRRRSLGRIRGPDASAVHPEPETILPWSEARSGTHVAAM
jgi:hypothetical protein